MKNFLVNITVMPMTITVLVITIGIFFMIKYYFMVMMENTAEILLKELAELQNDMLQNTKQLSSEMYENQMDEILLVRKGLVRA